MVRHVVIDRTWEISNLICGIFAVGGNYNLTRDTKHSACSNVKMVNLNLSVPIVNSVKVQNYETLIVSWSKVIGATGYTVYRSNSPKGRYVRVDDVHGTTYMDTRLTMNQKYYYRIRAHRNVKGKKPAWSDYSWCKSATPSLSIPKLSASVATLKKGIYLKWSTVPDANGYEIYRATSALTKPVYIGSVKKGGTSCIDNSVLANKTYYYRVRAYRGNTKRAYSKFSNQDSAKSKK